MPYVLLSRDVQTSMGRKCISMTSEVFPKEHHYQKATPIYQRCVCTSRLGLLGEKNRLSDSSKKVCVLYPRQFNLIYGINTHSFRSEVTRRREDVVRAVREKTENRLWVFQALGVAKRPASTDQAAAEAEAAADHTHMHPAFRHGMVCMNKHRCLLLLLLQ